MFFRRSIGGRLVVTQSSSLVRVAKPPTQRLEIINKLLRYPTSSLDFGAIFGQLLLRLRHTMRALTYHRFRIPLQSAPSPTPRSVEVRNSNGSKFRCDRKTSLDLDPRIFSTLRSGEPPVVGPVSGEFEGPIPNLIKGQTGGSAGRANPRHISGVN